jgi:hypothetical protein
VLLVMGATSGLFLPTMAVLAVAFWRDWPWGWLGAVLIAGLMAYFGLWILMGGDPLVGVINLASGLGLMATALRRAWPVIRRRRVAQIGLGLVVAVLIASAAVRFVVPTFLGWPAVTCGPGTTQADCLGWETAFRFGYFGYPTDLFPATKVTITNYQTCDEVARVRYLDGSERTLHFGGLC